MRRTRPRIWALGVVMAGAATVLVFHLYLLMVEQGDQWLQLSYRNRWGFKDVPTRRGSILDRRGRVVAEDVPAFALVLHYREFRRVNPIGCAVHGANLMLEEAGQGHTSFNFRPGRSGPAAALSWFLQMPVGWLRGEEIEKATARDLRFYTARLIAGLSDGRSRTVYQWLGELAVPSGTTLGEALGPAAVVRLHESLRARVEELDRLAAALDPDRLAAAFDPDRDLWGRLDKRRRALRKRRRAEEPPAAGAWNEHVLLTLYRRVPFDLAARVELQRERLAGLQLLPSVERRLRGVPGRPDLPSGRPDLASLRAIVGRVRAYWRDDFADEEDPEGAVDPATEAAAADETAEEEQNWFDAMLPADELAAFVPRNPDLPDELADRIESQVRANVENHLAIYGRRGRNGVERSFDAELAGRPGLRLVEKDRSAQEVGLWGALDTAPGEDVRLTIDLDLQAVVEPQLDEVVNDPVIESEYAALAVIDPATGDILAVGSAVLGDGRRRLAGEELPGDGKPVWSSLATQWKGVGYLGSVSKPFVLLELLDALRAGRATEGPGSFPSCDGGVLKVKGSKPLGCGYAHGVGGNDGVRAIEKSCNMFFYLAAQSLAQDGVDRAFQRVGLLPSDDDARWQPDVRGVGPMAAPEKEGRHVLERRAIGYGLQASALHVARAYAGLATGELPALRIVQSEPQITVSLGVAGEDLQVVRRGMRACVVSGTARSVAWPAGLAVLGKTGTAEITNAGRNNAWFAGYLSEDEPTLAFAAVVYDVADKQHGADVAGALVAQFLQAVYLDPDLRERYLPRSL